MTVHISTSTGDCSLRERWEHPPQVLLRVDSVATQLGLFTSGTSGTSATGTHFCGLIRWQHSWDCRTSNHREMWFTLYDRGASVFSEMTAL